MKYFYSILLSIMLFSNLYAQDSSKTSCKNFKHGIQFQLRNVLTLYNFNGYTFSYRYLLNNKSGLRLSFTSDIYDEEKEGDRNLEGEYWDDESIYYDYNLKFSFQYLQTVTEFEKFSLIVGAGPFYSYGNRKRHYEEFRGNYTMLNSDKDES